MDKRAVILMSATAIFGGLIGFTLGVSSADEVVMEQGECLALLEELEAGAYQPQSPALLEALQNTRAYLQEQR